MPATAPDADRPIRFLERRSIVAVYSVPQRDEPPGRGNWREVEVPLYATCVAIGEREVEGAIKKAARI